VTLLPAATATYDELGVARGAREAGAKLELTPDVAYFEIP
jgi:hypothetical protein